MGKPGAEAESQGLVEGFLLRHKHPAAPLYLASSLLSPRTLLTSSGTGVSSAGLWGRGWVPWREEEGPASEVFLAETPSGGPDG